MSKSEELKIAWSKAYSKENMEAHGAIGRKVEYIGTILKGSTCYIFYKDNAGDYWYKSKLQEEADGKQSSNSRKVG